MLCWEVNVLWCASHLYKPGRHGPRSAHDTVEPCPLSVNLPCNFMATWVHLGRGSVEPYGATRKYTWSRVCMAAHALLIARHHRGQGGPWPPGPMQSEKLHETMSLARVAP